MSSLSPITTPGRPTVVLAEGATDAASWVTAHADDVRRLVTEHGALVIRGLNITTEAGLHDAVTRIAPTLVVESEAFAVREDHPTGVYSSSAWPPQQQMCMHHELSYRLEFPGLMAFGCLAEPTAGGAFATADGSAVIAKLPQDLVARFEKEGWILERSYNDDIGLSIAEAFGTDDRAEVEQYCNANSISFQWTADGGLLTSQRRPAVVHHHKTGQRSWFNQIAFLSEWTLAPEVRDFFLMSYGEKGLPFNTRFGNGEPLTPDVVTTINEAYDSVTVNHPAVRGDLTLIDNIRTAHGRAAYEGNRQVIAALADPVRVADLAPPRP